MFVQYPAVCDSSSPSYSKYLEVHRKCLEVEQEFLSHGWVESTATSGTIGGGIVEKLVDGCKGFLGECEARGISVGAEKTVVGGRCDVAEGLVSGVSQGCEASGGRFDLQGTVVVEGGAEVVAEDGDPVVNLCDESKLERNRRWRKERKEVKLARQARGVDSRQAKGSGCRAGWRKPEGKKTPSEFWRAGFFDGDGEKSELRRSLEEKWRIQNELAAEKARKDLAFQKARDVDAESRKRRAAVMKSTERDKVAVEKAFATLKATGNVPGFCATVVDGSEVPSLSGGSGSPHDSISPDSSASMHEFREVQKKVLDLEAENAKLKREMKLNMVKYGPGATYSLNEAYTVTPSLREEFKKMEDEDHYVDEIPDPESDYRVTVRRVFVVPEFPDMWT